VLSKHDVPAGYLPMIMVWFADAADFRARAAAIQRNLTHDRRRSAANRKVIAACLAALSTDSGLRAAFRQRGVPDDRLTWVMREIVRDIDEEPGLLRYFYFVGGPGNQKTGECRELHALLMNLTGMWRDIKGERMPAIQGAPGKRLGAREEPIDAGGKPLSKPFIAMSRDLLEVLGRDDLVPSLEYVARGVVEELKMDGWHLLDPKSA